MTTESPAPQLAIANALLERGDARGAAERLAALLADEPGNVSALLVMARAQLSLKHPDKALVAAGHAVEAMPDSSYALYVLSAVLTSLGRHDEAVATAGRAVALEPHNPDRQDRLAWAWMASGAPGLPAAEAAARAAVALAPAEAEYRVTYGEVALRSGDKELARRAFRDALALEPDNADALHALGVLDVAMGNEWNLARIARGAEGLASALRADPRQQNSRLMLEIGLRRFLSRTGVLLVIPAYVGFRFAHDGHYGAARWLAVAAVALPVLTAAWFVLRLSRPLRAYLRMIVTSAGQRRALILSALAGVLLVAAATGPAAAVQWFLGAAALAGLLTRLATVTESNRRARAAGLEVPDYPSTMVLVVALLAGTLAGLICLPAAVLTRGDPGFVVGAALTLGAAGWSGYVLIKRRRR